MRLPNGDDSVKSGFILSKSNQQRQGCQGIERVPWGGGTHGRISSPVGRPREIIPPIGERETCHSGLSG